MLRKYSLAAIIIGGLATAIHAAPIAEVRFEQLNDGKLPEELLRYNVQQRAGQEYDPIAVNQDLKSLFASGFIDDPTAKTEKLPNGSIVLTYVVKAKPMVSTVSFEGNQKVSDREIVDRLTIFADSPLNSAKIDESLKNLKLYYREQGYTDATVTPQVKTNENGTVTVNFVIDEKLRYRVDHVTFEGNTVYSNWDLKRAINNRWNPLSWLLSTGLLDRSALDADAVILRNLFWDKGYLDFKIEDITVTPQAEDPVYVDLNFKLFEGEPYKVGKVSVVAPENGPVSAEELQLLIQLQPEKTFNYQEEEATRKAMIEALGAFGFADADVRAVRTADFQTHMVDVEFIVTEGRKYTARVMISGNERTKDKVIRRELAIHDDDPLDPQLVEISKQRLLGMGYFDKVEAYTTDTDNPDVRDVHFDVEEKDAYTLGVGGEYSDVNSLAGMLSVTNNNFDLFNPGNYFIGGGQRLRLAGIFGFHGGGGALDFSEPWLFDRPIRLDVGGFWNQTWLPDWKEERIGGQTAVTHKLFDDFTSATVGYKFEQVRVYDMDLASLDDETGRSWVSQTSLVLNRDTRDNLMNPTQGYNMRLLSAISPKVMGSSNNFYRLEASGAYYNNFWDKAIIWFVAGKVGTVSDFDRDNPVPVYERYFLGGGDSLRGFPWRSVSPLDSTDHAIGGQTMYLMTAEITHPIWRFIRGAVFTDIGNAFGNSYSFGPGGVNMGAGYGLRIMVPYLNMPVKLDLAYPVIYNQSSEDRSLRFHFNLGYSWNGF